MNYLDASFLFSLYFRDANTPAAVALAKGAGSPLLISALCELETVNAFCVRVFRKEMSALNMNHAIRDLEADIGSGILRFRPLPDSAFSRAKVLAQSLTPAIGVRAADLLHVAAAIELGATSLFTFDKRQHQTARAAGLKVNSLP